MRSYYVTEHDGCGLLGIAFALAACLAALVTVTFPLLWPLYVFGLTPKGWYSETVWFSSLVILFLLLGRHLTIRENRRKEPPASTPITQPGPRDWTDDGTRYL